MTNKKKVDAVVGSPVQSEGWSAVFFETTGEGFVDEETVVTVRVVCWVNLGGRVVGLIPAPEGLVSAESEPEFKSYVDMRERRSVESLIKNWDQSVEDDESEDEDEEEEDPENLG